MLKIVESQLTEEEKEKIKPVMDNREVLCCLNISTDKKSQRAILADYFRQGYYLDTFVSTTNFLITDTRKCVEYLRKEEGLRIVGWQQIDAKLCPEKVIYALYEFAPKVVQKAWEKMVKLPTYLWKMSNFEDMQRCLTTNNESNNQLTIGDYDMYGNFIEPEIDD